MRILDITVQVLENKTSQNAKYINQREGGHTMEKGDIITLSDGQTATIVKGSESQFNNIYIVRLENAQLRVVDKKTLTLAPVQGRV
jgi:hypothetical protein